jgi:hypothetical protein
LDVDKLWQLATPYLAKNDFGVAHTRRVFDIAKQDFSVKPELEALTFASIILHDIGGCSIKDQCEKGPPIATALLRQLNAPEDFITQVVAIVGSHHDHPDSPSEAFQVLYDADKLVMFSPEEYPYYNARYGFNWEKIVALIYSEKGKMLARENLRRRRAETR